MIIDAPPAPPQHTPPPPSSWTPAGRQPPPAPRRIPKPPVRYAPMTPLQSIARSALIVAVLLLGAFLLQVVVLSQLQHAASQQRQRDTFRAALENGVAPVSEIAPVEVADNEFEDRLIPDGSPVAAIDIPAIGVHEIVGEGTDGDTLKLGPGHRRDTPLPGQPGVSTVLGRQAAFGGPFSRIQELAPGEQITVRTGQGRSTFAVIGVRYAGDPLPPSLATGQSRLVLVSARGPAFVPQGIVYVDAALTSTVQSGGARQTTATSLAPEDRAMATDTRTVWALVFALQFLLVAHLGAVWARRRVGTRRTWIVGVPVVGLAVLLSVDRLLPLLPNLL